MKIYCVVNIDSKKVVKACYHKNTAITFASLRCDDENHYVVIEINLDEYMKQIM